MSMDKNIVLTPTAIKFSITKEAISVFFAEAPKPADEEITQADIQKSVQLDFSPNSLNAVVNALLKSLFEYQKAYEVDLGISIAKQQQSEGEEK